MEEGYLDLYNIRGGGWIPGPRGNQGMERRISRPRGNRQSGWREDEHFMAFYARHGRYFILILLYGS